MKAFVAKRRIHTNVQKLAAPPSAVFPLLCPVREYDWIEHWNCRMVWSESGVAEENAIFTTRFPGDPAEEVWVICRYEPDERIEFVRVIPEHRVIRYDISLKTLGEEKTEAHWTHTVTGLSEAGNAEIETLPETHYSQIVARLERMLNHYFKTGEMLREASVGNG